VSYKANFNHTELAADDQQGSPHASKEQEVIRSSTPFPSVTRITSLIVLMFRSESVDCSKPRVTRSSPTRVRSSRLRPRHDRLCRAQEAQGNICGLGRPRAPHPSSLGFSTYPAHLHPLRHCKQLNAQEQLLGQFGPLRRVFRSEEVLECILRQGVYFRIPEWRVIGMWR